MTWKIDKTIPTHAVPDLDAGIAFYTRLGFEVDWRWPDARPTHAGLCRGECSIMLRHCEPAVTGEVCFIVDDVAACHATIIASKCWEMAARAGRWRNAATARRTALPNRRPSPKRSRTACATSPSSTHGAIR